MKTKLVTFVTDGGFLVPSLVAALQLFDQGIQNFADIRIYTIDIDQKIIEKLAEAFAEKGINFKLLETKSFIPRNDIIFHKNHVPLASLARLSLHEVIENHYEDIIYIDGDVQIVGDVSGLVKYKVPDGMIMAGRGSAWLDVDGSQIKATPPGYLAALGDVSPHEYFNAGILAFQRSTWVQKAPSALRFFFENAEACIRHDQSALNAVFKGATVELAPKFNFHNIYSDLYLQRQYPPAIIHFTGPKKPWGYAGPPWGGQFQDSYRKIQVAYPFLQPFLTVAPKTILSTRGLSWHAKRWVAHGADLRRMRKIFFNHLAEASFPF